MIKSQKITNKKRKEKQRWEGTQGAKKEKKVLVVPTCAPSKQNKM
jgi:hypothetical protein